MVPKRFRAKKKKIFYSQENAKSTLPDVNSEELKSYAEEQRKRMTGYMIGKKDNSGNIISKIFSRGDDFLIYEIEGAAESDSFRVLVDTKIDSDPDGYVKKYEKIKPEISYFRSILHKGVHDKSVKHRAAGAISTALRGDIETSRKIFAEIDTSVQKEYKNISDGRLSYLGSSFIFTILFCLAAIIFYCNRDSVFVIKNSFLKHFFYAASFAALGGFFSICTNLKDIEFERSIELWKYGIYGVQRLTLAAICGVISYLLVASELLLSSITKGPNAALTLMAICVLAGFSEKLIHNALKRLESKED